MSNGARAEGIEANLFLHVLRPRRHPQVAGIITVGEFYEMAAGGQIIFT